MDSPDRLARPRDADDFRPDDRGSALISVTIVNHTDCSISVEPDPSPRHGGPVVHVGPPARQISLWTSWGMKRRLK